jgi:hypothetical protein
MFTNILTPIDVAESGMKKHQKFHLTSFGKEISRKFQIWNTFCTMVSPASDFGLRLNPFFQANSIHQY